MAACIVYEQAVFTPSLESVSPHATCSLAAHATLTAADPAPRPWPAPRSVCPSFSGGPVGLSSSPQVSTLVADSYFVWSTLRGPNAAAGTLSSLAPAWPHAQSPVPVVAPQVQYQERLDRGSRARAAYVLRAGPTCCKAHILLSLNVRFATAVGDTVVATLHVSVMDDDSLSN